MTNNEKIIKQYDIPKEKFKVVEGRTNLHDKELKTKQIGYLQDAFGRFKRNKGSVVAGVIIILLIVFALFVPIFSQYTVSYFDSDMKFCYPKSRISAAIGWDFWDGCVKKEYSESSFYYYYGMGVETGHNAIKNQKYTTKNVEGETKYVVRLDTYQKAGCIYMNLSDEDYKNLQAYQNKTNIQVIYPMTDKKFAPAAEHDANDANYWYATRQIDGKTVPVLDENGELTNIYKPFKKYPDTHSTYPGQPADFYDSITIESDRDPAGRKYLYAQKNQTGFGVRVNYYEYYKYYHTEIAKDGITEPIFLLGTDNYGKDVLTCLSAGARLSFILAIVVSAVNMLVGAFYGAVEGYYGGAADLIMERISDILSAVPFMIVITILKLHMKNAAMQQYGHLLILFISFFLTGWIGMAGRTRMQFYRFKNQEYVLAARTLGARDARIMFRHIFPNALGTLVTGQILVIPGMIFSESSLSYLGIINLNTGDLTSVGTLLANAEPYLHTYPYLMFSPALFISLLMLSFNLFGNGLRDAFNPSLRGAED